jgi:hypothetical protein
MARPNFALASATYPNVNSAYKRGAFLQVVLTFASGVPAIDEARSAPGFTIAGDTGVYTGTMPTAERGVLLTQLVTASVGAFATVTTLVPASGTFSFKTWTATAAALDVATGDEVFLLFLLEGG